MPIYDAHGTEITVGARVKPCGINIPGGVVARITNVDVDMNDDTGRPEAYGPFVYVLYDDGEEDRWTAYDKRAWYTDPAEWVCDEVEVERENASLAAQERV
jgi:hypothetical protein